MNTNRIATALSAALALTLAACGGGGGGTPANPNNQAPVARATAVDISDTGVNVALDGSLSNDADGDRLTYTWTILAKPAASGATIGSATAAKATFIPDAAGKYTLSLVVNDGHVDSAPVTVEVLAATPLGGVIGQSTQLSVERSPYRVVADVTVPQGVTLAVGPGVEILGANKKLAVKGVLNVAGTQAAPVALKDLTIRRENLGTDVSYIQACQVNIAWATVTGGTVYGSNPAWSACQLTLTDSKLSNTQLIEIVQGWGTNKIERNVFERAAGINYSLGSEAPNKTTLSIVNNRFVGWTGDFAVRNTGMSGNAEAVVKYNSFLSTDRVALAVKNPQDGSGLTGRMDGRDNFWGTTDLMSIYRMIQTEATTAGLGGPESLLVTPFLTEAHPNTP